MFRAIGLFLLAIVGYIGFVQYERYELNRSLDSAIRNASTRFSVQAQKTIDRPPGITTSERLSSLQIDISEIEKTRITIQQGVSNKTRKKIAEVDQYLKNIQSVLRALAARTRGEISLNIALAQHKTAMATLLDSVLTPFFDTANRGAQSSLDNVKAADADYQIAGSQLFLSITDLYESNKAIAQRFSSNDCVDPEIIKTFSAEVSKHQIQVNYGE